MALLFWLDISSKVDYGGFMAGIQTWQCDECGVKKEASNHWVIIMADERTFTMVPWRDDLASRGRPTHLCGAGCAAKVMSRVIGSWQRASAEAVSEAPQ
jgi:hypothetical protein